MSNTTIYKYPQSSCDCYNCTDNNNDTYIRGTPSNSSVGNCQLKDKFKCTNKIVFKEATAMKSQSGYIILNPNMGVTYASEFESADCKYPIDGCPTKTYVSSDPRLVDPRRNITTYLDRPPYTGDVKIDEIHNNKKLKKYGTDYKDYNNVNAGQIMYYYDRSIQDAYHEPNFTIPSDVQGILYQDPMSNIKPQYNRIPHKNIKPMDNPISDFGCLTFLSDTTSHREDIMSRQMSKMNQQKYSARWSK